jgi:hypothetical protein
MEMKDYIFKYELKDAWGMPLRGIVIGKDNAILFGCGTKEKNISINMDMIIPILEKNVDKLEAIDTFELPLP